MVFECLARFKVAMLSTAVLAKEKCFAGNSRITVNKDNFARFVQGQYTLAEKCFSRNEMYIPPYSLVFPAQLISDITKYKCKPSGKFKEKKRKRPHDSPSGPKTKKRKRQREDSNEISVCKTGHKTSEKRTPVAKARVSHVQKTLTHFSYHEQQPETPSTVVIVPSDSSDTHFACDASIDVYKYGHSKTIYRYQYQWLWAKFRQRHVNLPKLQCRNVWNSDGGHN